MTEVVPLTIVPRVGLNALDQTLLPGEKRVVELRDLEAVCEAIRTLRVRGAPLLGIVGAAGMAIAAERGDASDRSLHDAWRTLTDTRPTAVELSAIAGLALDVGRAAGPRAADRRSALWAFAQAHH
ncbi:MAG: hypothetical protein ABI939_09995, partial [Anaerolineaceae bacterium]